MKQDRDHGSGFAGRLRTFLRATRGVALIEFALVAIPFFMFIFGIVEVGLIFWAGYELENATATAARLIRTGQAQTAGYSITDLKTQLCNNVVILSNCASKVQISVQTSATFAGLTAPGALDSNGALKTSFTYSPGTASSIVLMNTYYEWPLTVYLTQAALSNLLDGNYLLQASVAFKNEPYPTS